MIIIGNILDMIGPYSPLDASSEASCMAFTYSVIFYQDDFKTTFYYIKNSQHNQRVLNP